jgi:hypothetical protein
MEQDVDLLGRLYTTRELEMREGERKRRGLEGDRECRQHVYGYERPQYLGLRVGCVQQRRWPNIATLITVHDHPAQ